jgi:hypothetical protein
MDTQFEDFDLDISRDDDVGLVIKAHLHIEHQLMEFIELHMPFKERCDWQRISFAGKVELALAFGLREELRKPLALVGKLRNDFAHNLNARLEEFDSLAMFNGLPPLLQKEIKHSYKKVKGIPFQPGRFDRRDILVLILINIRQAVKAAVVYSIEQGNHYTASSMDNRT